MNATEFTQETGLECTCNNVSNLLTRKEVLLKSLQEAYNEAISWNLALEDNIATPLGASIAVCKARVAELTKLFTDLEDAEIANRKKSPLKL